jgi:hypothetical protein
LFLLLDFFREGFELPMQRNGKGREKKDRGGGARCTSLSFWHMHFFQKVLCGGFLLPLLRNAQKVPQKKFSNKTKTPTYLTFSGYLPDIRRFQTKSSAPLATSAVLSRAPGFSGGCGPPWRAAVPQRLLAARGRRRPAAQFAI